MRNKRNKLFCLLFCVPFLIISTLSGFFHTDTYKRHEFSYSFHGAPIAKDKDIVLTSSISPESENFCITCFWNRIFQTNTLITYIHEVNFPPLEYVNSYKIFVTKSGGSRIFQSRAPPLAI